MTRGVIPLHVHTWRLIRSGSAKGIGTAALVAVVAVLLLSVGYYMTFNADKWSDAGVEAREAAASESTPLTERFNAIVAIERDVCASMKLLRELQTRGGQLGQSASNALATIATGQSAQK